MREKILAFISLVILGFGLTGCSLPFGKGAQAALQVASVPKATLFLNGEHQGSTPYFSEELQPGEYTVKLVPESDDVLLVPWETQVVLTKGVMTVVNHEFGPSEDESAGEIITLEPISDTKTAEIMVVSSPDGAVVSLDGEPQGFAPISLPNVEEGDHLITVSLPGYQEREIRAKAANGYQLAINAQLALEEAPEEEDLEATESAELEEGEGEAEVDGEQESEDEVTPTPTEEPKEADETPTPTPETSEATQTDLERPYVTIDSPSVGWVRVRKNPCTADEDRCQELAKADDGESFSLLDSENGWYKIEYSNSIEGWISGQYAEKYE